MTFESLVEEGAGVPVEGWDFGWFEGRATEERPPWGYAGLMGERMVSSYRALDVETGGGEVLAGIPEAPPLLVATESWPPNAALARERLRPRGGHVVAVADEPTLPFASASFDLVVSRHPVVTLWDEAGAGPRARRYVPLPAGGGGVEPGADRLRHGSAARERASPPRACPLGGGGSRSRGGRPADVHPAGRVLRHRRRRALPAQGVLDGARLHAGGVPVGVRRLHEQIEREGVFVSHATRFLIEARRPG